MSLTTSLEDHRSCGAAMQQEVSVASSSARDEHVVLPGRAPRFKALVIGNNAYSRQAPLSQCVNDASDMSQLLNDKGYTVHEVLNATLEGFHRAVRAFVDDLIDDCTVVVFYAGHGMAVGGANHFVPVDGNESGMLRVF